jgi:hypothetical protein
VFVSLSWLVLLLAGSGGSVRSGVVIVFAGLARRCLPGAAGALGAGGA